MWRLNSSLAGYRTETAWQSRGKHKDELVEAGKLSEGMTPEKNWRPERQPGADASITHQDTFGCVHLLSPDGITRSVKLTVYPDARKLR